MKIYLLLQLPWDHTRSYFFSTTFPYITLSSYTDLAILRLCHVCFDLGTLTLYLIFSTCNASLYLNPSKSHLSIHSVLFKGHVLREGCYVPTSKTASPHIILWLLPLDSYNFFCTHACSVGMSCPTRCDFLDYSSPGFSVHEISKGRLLDWVAISFYRESSQPRDWNHVFCIGRWVLYHWATREALMLFVYGIASCLLF